MEWWHLINYRFKSKKSITFNFQEIPHYPDDFKKINYNKLSRRDQVKLRNCYLAALDLFMYEPSFKKLVLCDLKKNTIPQDELPISLPLAHAYTKKEGDILSERDISLCIQLVLLHYIECSLKYPSLLELYFAPNYDMYVQIFKTLDEEHLKIVNDLGFYIKRCEPFNSIKLY